MKSLLLLALVLVSMGGVWWILQRVERFIRPRQSFRRFLLFFLAATACILAVVFVLSWLILHYRAFFFTP